MRIRKLIFIILGCICLALGTVGVVLPILPTVPFYMATLFFFSQSSEKLHDWFVGTELYKKNLKSFVEKKGMLMKTKVTILSTVTALMGFGFFMMKNVPVGRIILAIVWVAHMIYFIFGVKTVTKEELDEMKKKEDEAALLTVKDIEGEPICFKKDESSEEKLFG